MAFKSYKLRGASGRCENDDSWFWWEVLVNGRVYADGVCRSQEAADKALRYALDHINIDLNLLGNEPDFDCPWYD